MSQHLTVQTKVTTAQGSCEIVADGGSVYAEWDCTGRIGLCQGNLKLTAGSGRFEGITGSSPLVIRSPLRLLVVGVSDGMVLQVPSGLAVLPKLTYAVPQ